LYKQVPTGWYKIFEKWKNGVFTIFRQIFPFFQVKKNQHKVGTISEEI